MKYSVWFAKWEKLLSATNDEAEIEALMEAQTQEFADIADTMDFNA